MLLCAIAGVVAWIPQYRPPLKDGESYGIDVSSHQGHINWEAVKNDNIDFAFIKATEGGDYVDPRFHENWEGAATLQHRGAYHFFTLCTPGDAQADNFLKTVGGDATLAIDLELAGNCSKRPPVDDVRREIEAFTNKTGFLYFYVGSDFQEKYGDALPSERLEWNRRIYRRPAGDEMQIWQATGWAHVNGINGRVDLDVGAFPDFGWSRTAPIPQ